MKSFTLIEVIVYSVIITIVLGVIADFAVSFYQNNRYFLDQRQAVLEARTSLDEMVKDLRRATFSESGAYPIDKAWSDELKFYADVDKDGVIEKVTFSLNGSTLQKEVKSPNDVIEGTFTLSSVIRNTSQNTPLFRYYNASNQLVTNTNVLTDIRVVEISLVVNVDPNAPPNELLMNTWITLRNIK